METNNGRCGPLCQHPGCWQSDTTKIEIQRKKHNTQYDKYVDKLLHCNSPAVKLQRKEGLPVLTVQNIAIEKKCKEHSGTVTELPQTHPPSLSSSAHHTTSQQIHNVHVLLESTTNSPSQSSPLTFSPVLIWRPGSRHIISATQHRLRQPRHVAMKTHNLTDSLPPERPSSSRNSSKEKPRLTSTRPHSRLQYSMDLLQDIPEYIVNEIIQQLQSESASTLTPPTHHVVPNNPPTIMSHPHSCHIPSSIIYDLSTGQIHQTTPTPPSQSTTHALPQPDTSQSKIKPKAPSAVRVVRKRSVTLPPLKTSFSRALSQNPTSVLHKTEHVASTRHRSTTIHTINHTLQLPPDTTTTHSQPSISNSQHTVRYPLGNPTVPRTLYRPTIDPLLAPYHTTSSDNDDIKRGSLHNNMCLSHVHNTRLVTLHCMNTNSIMKANHTNITEDTTPPSPADTKNDDTNYLPPTLDSIPSQTTTQVSLTCTSPDHMHMGAVIIGDELVLDRAGEHVVHALRDSTSHTNVGGASRPETTPPTMGVVNGTKAPPPTAS